MWFKSSYKFPVVVAISFCVIGVTSTTPAPPGESGSIIFLLSTHIRGTIPPLFGGGRRGLVTSSASGTRQLVRSWPHACRCAESKGAIP